MPRLFDGAEHQEKEQVQKYLSRHSSFFSGIQVNPFSLAGPFFEPKTRRRLVARMPVSEVFFAGDENDLNIFSLKDRKHLPVGLSLRDQDLVPFGLHFWHSRSRFLNKSSSIAMTGHES